MPEEKNYPTHFQRAACWGALTSLSLLVLISITCGIIYGLYTGFLVFKVVLLPFIIAGVLAYLLYPCVVWVQNLLLKIFRQQSFKKLAYMRRTRTAAVIIVLTTTALIISGLLIHIIPPLVEQSSQLIAKREAILNNTVSSTCDFLEENSFARYVVDIVYENTPDKTGAELHQPTTPHVDKVLSIIEYYSETLVEMCSSWLFAGMRAIYGVVGYIIGLVIIPIALFYFLMNSGNISRKWHEIIPLPSSKLRSEIVDILSDINKYIIAFVRGQMLVSLIDGILLGIALTIMGLPYAIPIAAAAGIIGIIPYIGTILTCIPSLCIAWFHWHDINYVLGVAAIFFTVSQFDGWVLQPKLLGKLVHMHDLTIMFSILFWGSVFGGIVGALLAVPLTASIKVIFVHYVWSSFKKQEPQKDELPEESS